MLHLKIEHYDVFYNLSKTWQQQQVSFLTSHVIIMDFNATYYDIYLFIFLYSYVLAYDRFIESTKTVFISVLFLQQNRKKRKRKKLIIIIIIRETIIIIWVDKLIFHGIVYIYKIIYEKCMRVRMIEGT